MTDSENRKNANAMAGAKQDQQAEMRSDAAKMGGMNPNPQGTGMPPGQGPANQLGPGPGSQFMGGGKAPGGAPMGGAGVGGVQNPQASPMGGGMGGDPYVSALESRVAELEMLLGDMNSRLGGGAGAQAPTGRPEYGMGGDPNVQPAKGFSSFKKPYGPGRETSGKQVSAQRHQLAQEEVKRNARKKERQSLGKLGR